MGRAWSEGIRHRRCRAALVHHRSETAGRFAGATRLPTRWCHLPGKRGGSAIAPPGAVNHASGGSLRIPAPTVARSRTPSGPRRGVLAAGRSTTPGGSVRDRTPYCQPICNELLPAGLQRARLKQPTYCQPICNEPLVSLPRGVQRNRRPHRRRRRRGRKQRSGPGARRRTRARVDVPARCRPRRRARGGRPAVR